MKYITVKLTEDQAKRVVDLIESEQDRLHRKIVYYEATDAETNAYAFNKRIAKKYFAELVKL